jgi:hypothetical protein
MPALPAAADKTRPYLVGHELEQISESQASESRGYLQSWVQNERPSDSSIRKVFATTDQILRAGRLAVEGGADGQTATVAQDNDLDEWAVMTAALGLRASFQRCIEGYRDPVPRPIVAGVSTVEFVNWACALDELLENTDSSYKGRRDQHEYGRLMPALRFVRDRQTHQLVVTTSSFLFRARVSDDDNIPPTITLEKIYWASLEHIREPTDGARTHLYIALAERLMYNTWKVGSRNRRSNTYIISCLTKSLRVGSRFR